LRSIKSSGKTGEKASFDAGVHDIHPEIITLLGSLKYRTSYSQNVLQHSMDVSYLAGIMAAELKLNVKEAKRAGLLHDIGKAVDHKIEGTHAAIGADYAKRLERIHELFKRLRPTTMTDAIILCSVF